MNPMHHITEKMYVHESMCMFMHTHYANIQSIPSKLLTHPFNQTSNWS